MKRSTRHFLTILAVLPVLVVLAGLVYQAGMAELEDRPRTFWQAVLFAAETITTTGYGSDYAWSHPAMVFYVVTLQFFGVILVYMVVPLLLIPFLEERFEARLPRQVPAPERHVAIYRYGPAVETLCQDLALAQVPVLVLEQDEAVARRVRDQKIDLVFNETLGEGVEALHLATARALITNGTDEDNAACILVARQLGFEGEILALVEEPYHRKPLTLAGANAVFTPRHVLGAALAARASRRISPRVSGAQHLGEHVEVEEIRIEPGSPLAGSSLAESEVGAETGATVIGLWERGHLQPQPGADRRLEALDILIAIGDAESLDRLEELAGGSRMARPDRPYVVAGYGEVGQKVALLLRDAEEEVLVVDRQEGPGVDRVGDVLDPRVLEEVGANDAQGIILALDNDRATLFATVILKDLAPNVPIIARVNTADNVERIHRAGADFALSISTVSGRILAQRLLSQDAFAVDAHLKVLKVTRHTLGGRHPARAGIREATGCSVVAIERGEQVLTRFSEDFVLADSDILYVCGTRQTAKQFTTLYGA